MPHTDAQWMMFTFFAVGSAAGWLWLAVAAIDAMTGKRK